MLACPNSRQHGRDTRQNIAKLKPAMSHPDRLVGIQTTGGLVACPNYRQNDHAPFGRVFFGRGQVKAMIFGAPVGAGGFVVISTTQGGAARLGTVAPPNHSPSEFQMEPQTKKEASVAYSSKVSMLAHRGSESGSRGAEAAHLSHSALLAVEHRKASVSFFLVFTTSPDRSWL